MHVCSPSTFDIDALLEQVSADHPGGDPRAYARGLRAELSELRNPPRNSNPDDPEIQGERNCVDWLQITVTASEALCERTKDLRIACHLTEAAVQHWGIAGLRDGLCLLRRMSERFWETMAPELDPSDPDGRSAPLENLLDDPNRGPRLPSVLKSLPLLPAGELRLSLLDATRNNEEYSAQEISRALRGVTTDDACRLMSEIHEATEELDSFEQILEDRLEAQAPKFLHLRESLELLANWLKTVLEPQLKAAAEQEDAASQPAVSLDQPMNRKKTARPAAASEDPLQLRNEAYDQLRTAAETLQQIEPHSPIPYMINRAVRLGQLSFPELMRQLVNEDSTLEMFQRELDLASQRTDGSTDDD